MKVVILAGGYGTRLSEETKLKPKPMVEINSKPILWHLIEFYKSYGYYDFIICCGYKSNYIKNYFIKKVKIKDKKISYLNKKDIAINSKNLNIIIADTGLKTGTAGRLKKIKRHINKEKNFMMTYGDGLSDINLSKLIKHHYKQKKLVTVTAVNPPPRWGSLVIKGNNVTDINEKFSHKGDRINGGFFVISLKALDLIDNYNQHWEREPLKKISKKRQLNAYKHNGFWQPMDTLREKNLLNNIAKKKKAPWIINVKK